VKKESPADYADYRRDNISEDQRNQRENNLESEKMNKLWK
jgi:hypothetical protein